MARSFFTAPGPPWRWLLYLVYFLQIGAALAVLIITNTELYYHTILQENVYGVVVPVEWTCLLTYEGMMGAGGLPDPMPGFCILTQVGSSLSVGASLLLVLGLAYLAYQPSPTTLTKAVAAIYWLLHPVATIGWTVGVALIAWKVSDANSWLIVPQEGWRNAVAGLAGALLGLFLLPTLALAVWLARGTSEQGQLQGAYTTPAEGTGEADKPFAPSDTSDSEAGADTQAKGSRAGEFAVV